MNGCRCLAVALIVAAATARAGDDILPAYAQAILNGTDVPASGIEQVGCKSCGDLSLPPLPNPPTPAPMITMPCGGPDCACTEGCPTCGCKPGRTKGCEQCFPRKTHAGRFLGGLIDCVCCDDPCYDPVWSPVANAAFFMDTVRPKTYTRFRWDNGQNLKQPDRVEWFWARLGASGGGGKGPRRAETRVNYDELSIYQEVASGNAAFFFETTYRSVDPTVNDHHANFGDLTAGAKSLWVDCEFWNFGFQFKTYIPTGNPLNGIGTGHTSLEPSFLSTLKCSNDTYLQTQVAYWISVGGDRFYEGTVWHYHASLNHRWCCCGPLQFLTTHEVHGWTFVDGALTDFDRADRGFPRKASGESYISTATGARLIICDDFEIGFGANFFVTNDHFAQQLYRTEFKVRY